MAPDPARLVPHRKFPRYAYVPGLHPHPIKNPLGHSYVPEGETTSPPEYPSDWRASEDHLFAVDLLNHGYPWEAHEAWEELWHLAPLESPERLLLQGLIQYAAGTLKRSMENHRAADLLFQRARQKLEAQAPLATDTGLDLAIGALLHNGLPLRVAPLQPE